MPIKSSVYIGSGLVAAIGLGVALDSAMTRNKAPGGGGGSTSPGPSQQQILNQPPVVWLPTSQTTTSAGIPPLTAWNHPELTTVNLANNTYPAITEDGGPTVPWGIWLAASLFTVSQAGTYTVTAAAQSSAVLVLNGTNIGTVTGRQGLITEQVVLQSGLYVLAATISSNSQGVWNGAANSCPGYRCFTPLGGGILNSGPSWLYLTVANQSAGTVLTTEDNTAWYYLPTQQCPQTTYDVYAPDLALFGNTFSPILIRPTT